MQSSARTTLAAMLLATGFATLLLLGVSLVTPRATLACSCVAPMSLAEYAGEETVIFSGSVAADDGKGVLFEVDSWFSGVGAAPVIMINGDFGNGGSCGIGMRPPVGSSWLVVGWRRPAEGPLPELDTAPVSISMCQPFVGLATPEGQALLAEAVSTFGGAPVETTLPGAASSSPSPSPAADSPGPSSESLAAAGVVATLLAGLCVLAAVAVVARRRGASS